jgi:hypothetical protein
VLGKQFESFVGRQVGFLHAVLSGGEQGFVSKEDAPFIRFGMGREQSPSGAKVLRDASGLTAPKEDSGAEHMGACKA